MAELLVLLMMGVSAAQFILCLLYYMEARNPPRIRIDQPIQLPEPSPAVSVIIPVRDEEKNIRQCLESLLQQDYPHFEVIVVNDRSSDRTSLVVEQFTREDTRIIMVEGKKLEKGWLGKSHAIHQGVQVAHGEWLLFVDADTWLHPKSLSAAVDYVLRGSVDMLSLYPHFVCMTLWEKVLQPAVGRMILTRGATWLVNSRWRIFRIFYMAIGQFILIQKSVYKAVGGHEAIRTRVTEDVELAKIVKHAGYTLHFIYGIEVLHTRMYRTFSGLWRGWSRSCYPAMGNNVPQALLESTLMFIFATIPHINLPVTAILLGLGFTTKPVLLLFYLGLFQFALNLSTEYILRIKLNEYPNYFFTCPLGGILVQGISIHSLFTYAMGKKVLWKGRNVNA